MKGHKAQRSATQRIKVGLTMDSSMVSTELRVWRILPEQTIMPLVARLSYSHEDPYALSINRPHQLARRQGWSRGTITLARQPASREEAILWAKWLRDQGVTVSIGLLQVNSEHAVLLHLAPEDLFDPCTNLRSGAALLSATYAEIARIQGEGFAALDSALSYYNTGSPTAGLANGYVQQVKANAKSSEHQR